MPAHLTNTTCSLLNRRREHLKRVRVALSTRQAHVLLILGVTLLGLLWLAAPVLAVNTAAKASSAASTAGGAADPGQNLVTWLSGWVGGLFALAIGGAGIAVAARRHVGEGLALLLVAVMVGGFVVDPADMNTLTIGIWHKIATGA
jgi:hypothetical protein